MYKIKYSILIICSLFLTSCFNKYILTDKEIAEHYAGFKNPPRFKNYTIENRTIHYVESGNDTLPTLILIHGAPGAWYGYMNIVDDTLLQKKYHIVAVDRAGYGKSDYGKKETSIERQAALIKPLLDSNKNKKPAIVLGRSFGSPIAARIAADYPNQVGGLILLSSAADPDLEKFWWFSKLGKWWIVKQILPNALNVATAEKYAHKEELKKLLPLWQNIRIPTIVAQGGADAIVDPLNFDFTKRMLVNTKAEFVFIPEASHFITYNYPDLVRTWLIKMEK